SWNGTNGFKISGSQGGILFGGSFLDGEQSGYSVSAADVNGDGFSDLIIGARYANDNSQGKSGRAYVVFGADTATLQSHLNANSEGLLGNIGTAGLPGFRVL